MTSLLKQNNKLIKEIQQILAFIEVKQVNKQIIGMIRDLVILYKKYSFKREQNLRFRKHKALSTKKMFQL